MNPSYSRRAVLKRLGAGIAGAGIAGAGLAPHLSLANPSDLLRKAVLALD